MSLCFLTCFIFRTKADTLHQRWKKSQTCAFHAIPLTLGTPDIRWYLPLLCVQSGRIKSWASVSHNYNFSQENQHDFHLLWKEAKPQIPHGRHIPTPVYRGCAGEWRRAVLVASQEGLLVIAHPHGGVALSLASDQIQTHDLAELWSSCLEVYLHRALAWLPPGKVKADQADLYNWKKSHEFQLLCLVSRQHWSLFW